MTTLKVIAFSRPPAVLAAERQGFLAAEGLSVEYTITRGSVEQIRGLRGGVWDIAHTAADNVMAYNDRDQANLRVFLVADLGLGQKLFVLPRYRQYQDLTDQTLAVDALDTGYAFVLRKMLEHHGIARDRYQLQSVGGTRERFEAMRRESVAGALLSPPYDSAALDLGFRMLQAADEIFPDYPGLTCATTQSFVESHFEVLVSYARALARGARWASDPANRERVEGYVAEDQGVDQNAAQRRLHIELSAIRRLLPTVQETMAALKTVRALRDEMTGERHLEDPSFEPRVMRLLESSVH